MNKIEAIKTVWGEKAVKDHDKWEYKLPAERSDTVPSWAWEERLVEVYDVHCYVWDNFLARNVSDDSLLRWPKKTEELLPEYEEVVIDVNMINGIPKIGPYYSLVQGGVVANKGFVQASFIYQLNETETAEETFPIMWTARDGGWLERRTADCCIPVYPIKVRCVRWRQKPVQKHIDMDGSVHEVDAK